MALIFADDQQMINKLFKGHITYIHLLVLDDTEYRQLLPCGHQAHWEVG